MANFKDKIQKINDFFKKYNEKFDDINDMAMTAEKNIKEEFKSCRECGNSTNCDADFLRRYQPSNSTEKFRRRKEDHA